MNDKSERFRSVLRLRLPEAVARRSLRDRRSTTQRRGYVRENPIVAAKRDIDEALADHDVAKHYDETFGDRSSAFRAVHRHILEQQALVTRAVLEHEHDALDRRSRRRTKWVFLGALVLAGAALPWLLSQLGGIDAKAALALFVATGALTATFLVGQPAIRYAEAAWSSVRVRRGHRYVLYLRSSEIDIDPLERKFESSLVRAVARIGPTISVAPRTLLRRSSAIRLSFSDDVWEAEVEKLARGAALVVIALAPRRGYDHEANAVDGVWTELETLPETLYRGRVLLYFGRHWDDRALTLINRNGTIHFGVTTLVSEVRRVLPEQVSATVPDALEGRRWLWFHPGGSTVSLGTGYGVPGVQALQRWIIRDELRPVLESFGIEQGSWTHALLAIGLATGTYVAIRVLPLLTGNGFFGLVTQPRAMALAGAFAWATVALLRFPVMRRRYYRWRYGEYKNFVLATKYYRG